MAGRPLLSVRFDNDVFGGRRQDQNYTGDTVVTAYSPNLVHNKGDDCLPPSLARTQRDVGWLNAPNATQQTICIEWPIWPSHPVIATALT